MKPESVSLPHHPSLNYASVEDELNGRNFFRFVPNRLKFGVQEGDVFAHLLHDLGAEPRTHGGGFQHAEVNEEKIISAPPSVDLQAFTHRDLREHQLLVAHWCFDASLRAEDSRRPADESCGQAEDDEDEREGIFPDGVHGVILSGVVGSTPQKFFYGDERWVFGRFFNI